jgi:c-di-GMP-binding flagellar brake protein YcgR
MNPREMVPLWDNQALILECEDRAIYYTRIIGIKENTIFIQYPVNKDRVPMNQVEKKQVSVSFYNDQKQQCVFDTTLKYDSENVFFTIPDISSGSIQKVQRRQYFRVPARLQIWLETESGGKHSFITDDISGGGVAFWARYTDIPIVDNVVAGGIYLNGKSGKVEIPFRARIVNIRTDSNASTRIAIQFIDMMESQRNKVISYCLKRQIEIRNRIGKLHST